MTTAHFRHRKNISLPMEGDGMLYARKVQVSRALLPLFPAEISRLGRAGESSRRWALLGRLASGQDVCKERGSPGRRRTSPSPGPGQTIPSGAGRLCQSLPPAPEPLLHGDPRGRPGSPGLEARRRGKAAAPQRAASSPRSPRYRWPPPHPPLPHPHRAIATRHSAQVLRDDGSPPPCTRQSRPRPRAV